MHYISFELDEDYPFRITNNTIKYTDGLRLEIAVYGTATIAVQDREDWWLDGLTLKASNGKYGDKAEGWDHEIEAGHFFFEAIKEYLETAARDRVEAEIGSYFAELRDSRLFDDGKVMASERRFGEAAE